MTVTVKITFGTGTFISPTFRAYSCIKKIRCNRVDKLGNLIYLYNTGGYVICTVDPDTIIKMEE